MLVLSRKPGEQIHIGSDVILTVLQVQGKRVRVGIDAPLVVQIRRNELVDASAGASSEQKKGKAKRGIMPEAAASRSFIGV